MDQNPAPESQFGAPSRRTYFAEERTVLAWWRTGISSAPVVLAVGGLLPHVAHLSRARFIALGAGYGAVALFFVIGGNFRARASHRALEHDTYAAFSGAVITIATCYISVLVILTVVAFP
jgi:putative membrane protein